MKLPWSKHRDPLDHGWRAALRTPAGAEAEAYAALAAGEDQSPDAVLAGLRAAAGVPEAGDTDSRMIDAWVSVMEGDTDAAREAIRTLSPRDQAVLSFYAGELSRVLLEEDTFRAAEDRRKARRRHEDRTAGDSPEVPGWDESSDPLEP